jgi:hypothetical protein
MLERKNKKGVIYYIAQTLLLIIVGGAGLFLIPILLCVLTVGFIILNFFVEVPEKTEKYTYHILIVTVIIGIIFYSYILFYR